MNKHRTTSRLLIIAVGYSAVLLITGFYINPRAIYPIGLILGLITFFLIYKMPLKTTAFLDALVFLVPIVGGAVGSTLLWFFCKFNQKPVCAPAQFNAQVFGNFAFPILIITILWLTQRVPVFFGKK